MKIQALKAHHLTCELEHTAWNSVTAHPTRPALVVEIVTADGEIRTASRDTNADLFWAIRGGGGNFGVVSRFTFRLHEVGPTITGGLIAWGADRAGEILDTYRRITESAPRELTVATEVFTAPAAPFIPE